MKDQDEKRHSLSYFQGKVQIYNKQSRFEYNHKSYNDLLFTLFSTQVVPSIDWTPIDGDLIIIKSWYGRLNLLIGWNGRVKEFADSTTFELDQCPHKNITIYDKVE